MAKTSGCEPEILTLFFKRVISRVVLVRWLICLMLCFPLAAQVTVSGNGSSSTNGFTVVGGTAIAGVANNDTMWSDSTDGRWKVNNHNGAAQDLAVWPCRLTAGGVVYASTSLNTFSIYPETCLPAGTSGQILMLSGSTPAPSWSSSYVASVAGTSNQISVTGSTALTLSIANPFIFPGKATLAASTASAESLNVPSGTVPTSPANGAIFYDGSELYFNDGVASEPHPRIVRLAADSSASTSTTPANLTGMSFSLVANTNYTIVCDLFYQVSSTTGSPGLAIDFTGPASPNNVIFGGSLAISGSAPTNASSSVYGTPFFNHAASAASTIYPGHVSGTIENGANPGNVQLQYANIVSGSSSVTVKRGSWCTIQ